jgi:hypothetical protein
VGAIVSPLTAPLRGAAVENVRIFVALDPGVWNAIKKQIPGVRRRAFTEKPATHQAQLFADLREEERRIQDEGGGRLIVVMSPLEHEDVRPLCDRLIMEFTSETVVYVVCGKRVTRYRSRLQTRSLTDKELVKKLRRWARRTHRPPSSH